jgi:circadian clock protein KaiC
MKKASKAREKKPSRRTHVSSRTASGKIERITSGIPNLNPLIEGGFENRSTNLIVGNSGSGKSIFATQFAVGGMDQGEKCLYVTFEENKDEFYANMLNFGWDLEDYERRGLFTFLEYTPLKVKMMLEEGGGDIESIILKEKISRVVIDSITSFALLFEDELSKREAAMTLFNMIRRWNCTSLLTLEEEPNTKEKTGSKSLEFEVDSIVLIYYVRNKTQRERYLEILKMRGTNHSHHIYRFDVTKSGIAIDKNPCSNPPSLI